MRLSYARAQSLFFIQAGHYDRKIHILHRVLFSRFYNSVNGKSIVLQHLLEAVPVFSESGVRILQVSLAKKKLDIPICSSLHIIQLPGQIARQTSGI